MAGSMLAGSYHTLNNLSFGILDHDVSLDTFMTSSDSQFSRGWKTGTESAWMLDGATMAFGGTSSSIGARVIQNSKTVTKTANTSFQISGKKIEQLARRGWDDTKIENVIQNPMKTAKTIDKATGEEATAYFIDTNQYVVRGNTSGKIIQGSDLSKPDWKIDDIFTH